MNSKKGDTYQDAIDAVQQVLDEVDAAAIKRKEQVEQLKPALKLQQDEDAKRLKALFAANAKPRWTQETFGREFDIGSGQMVWQYLSGHRPLNMDVASKFAKGLGVPLGEISPRLANDLSALLTLIREDKERSETDRAISYIRDNMTAEQLRGWLTFGRYLLHKGDPNDVYQNPARKEAGPRLSFSSKTAADDRPTAFDFSPKKK